MSKIVDTIFFAFFICLFVTVCGCLIFTWVKGDPRILLYNIDSNGNLCGTKSSGLDLSDRPLLFLFDSFYFPHQSYSICTDRCPEYDLKTKSEVYSYANATQHLMCNYGLPVRDYVSADFGRQGNCPMLPVLKSVDFLHVCIPEVTINSAQALGYIDLVVPLVNQSFRSIYNYWPFNAIAIIAAFFLASVLFVLMRCLSKCVLAAVFPIMVVAILSGFGSIWFAYHVVCKRLSRASSTTSPLPLNSFEVYNEVALFVIAVLMTVIVVASIIILLLNVRTFPRELNRLFKIFAEFLDSTKYAIWLPAVGSLAIGVVLTGAVASAFCTLSLVELKPNQSFNRWDFYIMPKPPYQDWPEKPAMGFAVVLALLWLPRIVVNAIKLAVHVAASQFLLNSLAGIPGMKSSETYKSSGFAPSWFSLMCTAVTISFAECIVAPFSFLIGCFLALLTPCETCMHSVNDWLRSMTFWIPVGYATQASVTSTDDCQTAFYRAVGDGISELNKISPRHKRQHCVALVAAEWFLLCATAAIFSLPICAAILQMRYPELLSLSAPSLFLVIFFGYWIGAVSLAPFSAAFTTFCLNYDHVIEIVEGQDNLDGKAYANKADLGAAKQNIANWEWERQGKA